MFAYERSDDRLTLRRPDTRWLSTGFDGGYACADAAHNLTVESGFERTDLATYVRERLGSVPAGPTLLTGVEQTNARGARHGPVEVVATAGLSNPALFPSTGAVRESAGATPDTDTFDPGTVNIFAGCAEPLTDDGLAGLLATAVEAKTATLLDLAGCTGTTSDAVVVGSPDEAGGRAFAGSATEVGNAARVCVREAVSAALKARYGSLDDLPDTQTVEHTTFTSGVAAVFEP